MKFKSLLELNVFPLNRVFDKSDYIFCFILFLYIRVNEEGDKEFTIGLSQYYFLLANNCSNLKTLIKNMTNIL